MLLLLLLDSLSNEVLIQLHDDLVTAQLGGLAAPDAVALIGADGGGEGDRDYNRVKNRTFDLAEGKTVNKLPYGVHYFSLCFVSEACSVSFGNASSLLIKGESDVCEGFGINGGRGRLGIFTSILLTASATTCMHHQHRVSWVRLRVHQ